MGPRHDDEKGRCFGRANTINEDKPIIRAENIVSIPCAGWLQSVMFPFSFSALVGELDGPPGNAYVQYVVSDISLLRRGMSGDGGIDFNAHRGSR